MAVPKKKTSRSKRNKRRSHHALRQQPLPSCPRCGAPAKPHHVCTACGYYRGVDVLKLEEA